MADKSSQPEPSAAAPAPAPKYVVRPADPLAQRETIVALWRDNLGTPDALPAKFQWYYVDHPLGQPAVLFLCHGPDAMPVGVAANGGRRMRLNGQIVQAGIRVDLAVDAAHRTLFPALQLQRAVRQAGMDQFDLLYGLPNRKAEKIVERIGFTQKHEFVRYACVLRWHDYLGRVVPPRLARLAAPLVNGAQQVVTALRCLRLPGVRSAWVSRADERFDALWERSAWPGLLMGSRDSRFLNWRFVARPGSNCRILALTEGSADELIAYAVCEIDGATATVLDFFVDAQRHGGVKRLLPQLLLRVQRQAYRLGCTSLSLHFFGSADVKAALAGAGFKPRDSHPVFIDIPPRNAERLGVFDYYFTGADEDQ